MGQCLNIRSVLRWQREHFYRRTDCRRVQFLQAHKSILVTSHEEFIAHFHCLPTFDVTPKIRGASSLRTLLARHIVNLGDAALCYNWPHIYSSWPSSCRSIYQNSGEMIRYASCIPLGRNKRAFARRQKKTNEANRVARNIKHRYPRSECLNKRALL